MSFELATTLFCHLHSLSFVHIVEKTFREGLIIEARRREKKQAKKKVFVFILVFYIW